MRHVEKVAHDLYFVKHPVRKDRFCGVTVVLGENEIGLVDTEFESVAAAKKF